MNTNDTPQRGFFIGKASKYGLSIALTLMAFVPTGTKAVTMTVSGGVDNTAATASAIIANTGILAANSLPMPAIQASLVWVTAYTSVPNETDSNPFITADGAYVHDGIVAANWLPFGTKIKIPALFGNKIFTVEDRMNAMFNNRMDIWMPNVTKAINFGIQRLEVIVVSTPTPTTNS